MSSREPRPSALASGPVVAALAILALPFPAAPQQPDPGVPARDTSDRGVPDTVRYRIESLAVEAARPAVTGTGATAVRLEMDSVETVPSPTLAEVLRGMPLIRVRRNSRGQVQPSLRGMEERQIAILADGVPLTVGWDNRSDLSVIPMTAASRVEMVRGLSSVLAGPNALGGVIRIGLARGPMPDTLRRQVDLRTSVDQEGAWALAGQVDHLAEAGDGRLWVKYGGGYRRREGYPAPAGLDPRALVDGGRLPNSDLEFANGFAAVRYRADGGTWLALSSAGYWTEQGVVPELHLLGGEEPAPRFWRYPNQWQSFTSLSAGTGWRETPLGRGDLEASAGLDLRHLEIDSFASAAYRDSVAGETGDDRTLSLRLLGDHTLGPGTLSASFTWAETWHEQTLSSAPGDPEEFVQRLWSLGVETTQPLLSSGGGWLDQLRVTVGGSYDASSTPETGEAEPRLGIDGWGLRASAEALLPGGSTTLHGGVSRKVRFPALRELFSGALGKFEPNPDLGPLTLKVGELGATLRPAAGLEVQATLFQQRLEGSIVRAVLPDGRFQRQNRGETRATGVEVAGNWRAEGVVTLRADLTLQEVELLDDAGQPVPGERAEYQPEVAGGLHAAVPAPAGFRVRAGLEYLGSQYGANPRTGRFVELEPTTWLEAGLGRGLTGGLAGLPPLRASLVVENLADEVVYDQLGLPRPGRTVRLQLELR